MLTASAPGVTDADNVDPDQSDRRDHGPVAFYWQVERDPVDAPACSRTSSTKPAAIRPDRSGRSFTVTADLGRPALRVKAIYQDAHGVLETVFSAATAPVAARHRAGARAASCPTAATSPSEGIHLIRADLQFILDQIMIAERHAAGEDILDLIAELAAAVRPAHG